MVCSIEESNNIEKMTGDTLQSNLLINEQMMRICGEEQVLKISQEDKSNRG